MLNAQRDSISKALFINNGLPPPDPSASPFGFNSAGSPEQLLDSSLQFSQNKQAGNEYSQEQTQGFMISSDSEPEFRRQAVATDFNSAEAALVTTMELRPPHSAGLGTSASLSVNGGGTNKVGKKRSRASKRSPTTLLNTNPSNFKAMVQRFTGIPETPFGYSSMNPTNFSAHVGRQDWQLLGKPLPYKAVLDLNMNSVSHLNSDPDSFCPQQYNSTTFIPFQSLNDCINNSDPKYPQGLEAVGLNNSVFPSPAITSSSDGRPAYLR